jgi:hypothetical protein
MNSCFIFEVDAVVAVALMLTALAETPLLELCPILYVLPTMVLLGLSCNSYCYFDYFNRNSSSTVAPISIISSAAADEATSSL